MELKAFCSDPPTPTPPAYGEHTEETLGRHVLDLLQETDYSSTAQTDGSPRLFAAEGLDILQRAVLHTADKEHSFARKPAETPYHLSLSCKEAVNHVGSSWKDPEGAGPSLLDPGRLSESEPGLSLTPSWR
ncbi:unnamed protein product [Pleuronectes platessa]|uniref:Uncharacterized protein n=1 Tax=Pleuronectes platessa TaxID=8262 RepID=A0A9N7TQL5_PLEPL|nr:unnamed protein product [Pleuronectes platessa]